MDGHSLKIIHSNKNVSFKNGIENELKNDKYFQDFAQRKATFTSFALIGTYIASKLNVKK